MFAHGILSFRMMISLIADEVSPSVKLKESSDGLLLVVDLL